MKSEGWSDICIIACPVDACTECSLVARWHVSYGEDECDSEQGSRHNCDYQRLYIAAKLGSDLRPQILDWLCASNEG